MLIEYTDELELEREKLDQLIDEAFKKGTPICETTDIITQSKKVNELILKTKQE